MVEPDAINPARFSEFIAGPGLAVVFVSVHPAHTFNRALCEHFGSQAGKPVVFGTLDLVDLVLSATSALPFLHRGLRDCGAPSSFGVLPGYWLFRAGRLLAWEAGLPKPVDAKSILRAGILGAIWSGISGKWSFVGQALHVASDDVAAQRIASAFRRADENVAANPHVAADPPVANPAEELFWAYQILGVAPGATDQEVHEAWRRRRVEVHPDAVAGDPVEFERRTRLSVDINRAREIVFKQRGRSQQQAAA